MRKLSGSKKDDLKQARGLEVPRTDTIVYYPTIPGLGLASGDLFREYELAKSEFKAGERIALVTKTGKNVADCISKVRSPANLVVVAHSVEGEDIIGGGGMVEKLSLRTGQTLAKEIVGWVGKKSLRGVNVWLWACCAASGKGAAWSFASALNKQVEGASVYATRYPIGGIISWMRTGDAFNSDTFLKIESSGKAF